MYFPELPPQDLGRADHVNNSVAIVYTPVSELTQEIMNKTAFALLKGRCTNGNKELLTLFYIFFNTR